MALTAGRSPNSPPSKGLGEAKHRMSVIFVLLNIGNVYPSELMRLISVFMVLSASAVST